MIGVGAIKPRRLFAAGATLRGVQLHTPLCRLFDPPAHFGAGINLLALFDGIAWPASFTLGWAASKPFWTLYELGLPLANATNATNAALGAIEPAARATHPRRDAEFTPGWNGWRDGVRLQLHVPAVHLSAIVIADLVTNGKWRGLKWTLVGLLATMRWV